MSKNNVTKEIQKEINILNQEIDRKIVRGLSYRREAQRHQYLRVQLYKMTRASQSSGWMTKSLGFVSTFIF